MSKPHPFADPSMSPTKRKRSTEDKNTLAKEGLHPDEFVEAIHGVKGRCLEHSERSLPKE
nr:hypothetical protein [uncultured Porphyromonas sp.]